MTQNSKQLSCTTTNKRLITQMEVERFHIEPREVTGRHSSKGGCPIPQKRETVVVTVTSRHSPNDTEWPHFGSVPNTIESLVAPPSKYIESTENNTTNIIGEGWLRGMQREQKYTNTVKHCVPKCNILAKSASIWALIMAACANDTACSITTYFCSDCSQSPCIATFGMRFMRSRDTTRAVGKYLHSSIDHVYPDAIDIQNFYCLLQWNDTIFPHIFINLTTFFRTYFVCEISLL